MLRVFIFEERYSVTLRLEGQLTSEAVPMLLQRWATVRSGTEPRRIVVDLGDVTELDASGGDALKWLVASGAQIGYIQPKLRWRIETFICDNPTQSNLAANLWDQVHVHSCRDQWGSPMAWICRLLCAVLPSAWRPCGCQHTRDLNADLAVCPGSQRNLHAQESRH